MTVEEREVELPKSTQLEEAFLTKINPKGQVSMLTYLWTHSLIEGNIHTGPGFNAPNFTS